MKLTIKDQTVTVPLDRDKPNYINTLEEVDNHKAFTDFVLEEFEDVIAKNPNRPSVTHLVEFTIDTGDSKPIYNKSRNFNPDCKLRLMRN